MVTLVLLPGMDGTGLLFAPFVAVTQHLFNIRIVEYPATAALDYEAL